MKQMTRDPGPPRVPPRRRPLVLLASATAMALVMSACVSDDDAQQDDSTEAAAQQPADEGAYGAPDATTPVAAAPDDMATSYAMDLVQEGQQIFRYDTMGSERFWGDTLHIHDAIQGEANGGFGPGVSPVTALSVGLKVDVDAIPAEVQDALAAGEVDLEDPNVTLTLLQLDAVVGVKGFFNDDGTLRSVGVECAVCHSTVDDSFAPGVGHRLDGWANRDLNTGAILNLAQDEGLQPVADMLHTDVATVRQVITSWGPGKFDAELNLDGQAFQTNEDGSIRTDDEGNPLSGATLIPPAFGLAGVNLHTWTGFGGVPHWNAYVGNLEMNGSGTFWDPRLNDPEKYPIAVEQGFWNVRNEPDEISSKLAALQMYQLALAAPAPPGDIFDAEAAARGEELFLGRAECATCHVPPLFTEPGYNAHAPEDIGIDSFQADRSPDGVYRTSPLRGLWTHLDSGFYHDGRFESLLDVIDHYDQFFELELSGDEKQDLVEYLKSL